MRAIDLGKRVALVERDRIGGTGIYNGALASKTLWELSHRVATANEVLRGRGSEAFGLSWGEVSKAVNEALFERKYLHTCHLQMIASRTDEAARAFRHVRGQASFVDARAVQVERGGTATRIEADHFIVATGSRPRQVPGIAVDERRILTSDGILAITDLPRSIVIVGAGVVGC